MIHDILKNVEEEKNHIESNKFNLKLEIYIDLINWIIFKL